MNVTPSPQMNKALQVLEQVAQGSSVIQACEVVGMPRSTYYAYLNQHPEILLELRAMLEQQRIQQFALYADAIPKISDKLIEEALSPKTSPRDRLAIFKTLYQLQAEALQQPLLIEDENEKKAAEFLKKGPVTRHVESRFSADLDNSGQ